MFYIILIYLNTHLFTGYAENKDEDRDFNPRKLYTARAVQNRESYNYTVRARNPVKLDV